MTAFSLLSMFVKTGDVCSADLSARLHLEFLRTSAQSDPAGTSVRIEITKISRLSRTKPFMPLRAHGFRRAVMTSIAERQYMLTSPGFGESWVPRGRQGALALSWLPRFVGCELSRSLICIYEGRSDTDRQRRNFRGECLHVLAANKPLTHAACLEYGNSNMLFEFHPENWGRWSQFDLSFFSNGLNQTTS